MTRYILIFIVFLIFFASLINTQEVHVLFKEEFVLDVAQCEDEDCILSNDGDKTKLCPDGSEHWMLTNDDNYDDNNLMPVCASSSYAANEKKRSMMNEDDSVGFPSQNFEIIGAQSMDENDTLGTDEIFLDVSVLIHLGLNDVDEREAHFNFTVLGDAFDFFHFSFQEYLALDVVHETAFGPCPQGFEVEWLPASSLLLEFSVCPFRWTYSLIQQQHPSFFHSTMISVPSSDFSSFLLSPSMMNITNKGQRYVLIDQEFMITIPCFPGTFCSGATMTPNACPVASFNPMYGQNQCEACPFNFSTNAQGSSSLDKCNGTDVGSAYEKTLLLSEAFVMTNDNNTHDFYSDVLDAQDLLKTGIFEWISSMLLDESSLHQDPTEIELHILNWEITL